MSIARTGLAVLLILGASVAALGARAFDLAQSTTRKKLAASAARASAESLTAHVSATRERTLIARLRARVRETPGLLLAVAMDSGAATLLRDGLPLRQMSLATDSTGIDSLKVTMRGDYLVERVAPPLVFVRVAGSPTSDSDDGRLGALRFVPRDLQAIKPNLVPGTTVVIY